MVGDLAQRRSAAGARSWAAALDRHAPGRAGAREAKGLEFDTVLLVEPQRMDPADLYVALTRATQRLGVVHTEPLPASLRRLSSRRAAPPRARTAPGTSR